MMDDVYTIMIVDDETDAQLILKEFIFRYCQNVEVVGAASTIKEAKVMIAELRPDILLLDISLKEGTGFDLLELIDDPSFQIIFTTAYDQHAVKAFKVRALDYLLKPIDPYELKGAIEHCCETISQTDQIKKLNSALEKYAYEKISIPSKHSHIITDLIDIVRCQSDGNYTRFFIKNDKPILVAKTLKEFDNMLSSKKFIRVHQSHLVNRLHIRSFQVSANLLVLSNGDEIPISRRKKSILLKELSAQIID